MEERRHILAVILEWERKLMLMHRIVLLVTLWMTFRAFEWAGKYAFSGIETNGIEAAAIIAAVTAPITYLQKVVFETYSSARKDKP